MSSSTHALAAPQVIVYLETGTGKTLIAALLVKHFVDMEKGQPHEAPRNIVCLVPTSILVEQQAAVFRKTVQVGVGEYTGNHGVDSWTPDLWEQEYKYALPHRTCDPQLLPSAHVAYVASCTSLVVPCPWWPPGRGGRDESGGVRSAVPVCAGSTRCLS